MARKKIGAIVPLTQNVINGLKGPEKDIAQELFGIFETKKKMMAIATAGMTNAVVADSFYVAGCIAVAPVFHERELYPLIYWVHVTLPLGRYEVDTRDIPGIDQKDNSCAVCRVAKYFEEDPLQAIEGVIRFGHKLPDRQ